MPVNRTVFISSTFEDLREHRRAVWDVLEGFEVSVRGMEQFGARSETPLETCLAAVEQSDVYVGLLAYRLGSVHPDSGKSFTQLEYEQALNLGQDVLIYIADDQTAVFPHNLTDTDSSRVEKLRAFKTTLRDRHTVSFFSTPEDLSSKIESDFRQYFDERTPDDRLAENEFTSAQATVQRFLLMPKSANGQEIRVKVAFEGNPFAASRGICEAFNLEYGRTIGVRVRLDEPSGSEASKFRQLYATRQQADALLALIGSGGAHDVYARLLFGEKDIPRIIAEFFGYNAYPYDDYDRGEEIWIPPEGHVILLFSKVPEATTLGASSGGASSEA